MIQITEKELEISFTPSASKQLKLIFENDYTIDGLVFRLHISGKGCHGFDYSLGFTKSETDDLVHKTDNNCLSIDPFTAFYAKEGVIDYINDTKRGEEGFVFSNCNQRNYKGKFFKDETTLPLQAES